MLGPAHIVVISKTGYVLATPRCLEWRHALPGTGTNNDSWNSDSLDPCRRRAGRRRGDRLSGRLPVARVLVVEGRITRRRRSAEDGCFEIYGKRADKRVEAFFDPTTGKQIAEE